MTLENLKRIAAARTKGEWRWNTEFVVDHPDLNHPDGECVSASKSIIQSWDYEGYSSGIYIRDTDAKFIATAANTYDALIEIAEAALAAEKKFMAIDDGFYTGLVPPEFGDVSIALRKLSKLTSGGDV